MADLKGAGSGLRSHFWRVLTHAVVALLSAVCAVLGYRMVSDKDPPGDPRPSEAAGDAASPWQERPLVHLAVAGDTGTGTQSQHDTVAAMQRAASGPFDGVLLLGDLIYDAGGDPSLVDERIVKPFAPLTQEGADLLPVLGDHEVEAGYQDDILERFGLTRSYYAHRLGALRIVVLDTYQVTAAQRAWLEKTLSRSPRGVRWTIAAMHRPPYSAGESDSSIDVRDAWAPLFERFEVPLVLAGENHAYERSRPIRGVTYVVSGAGAKTSAVGSQSFTEVSASVLHFLDVAVYRDRIDVQAINQDDELVDRFTLD